MKIYTCRFLARENNSNVFLCHTEYKLAASKEQLLKKLRKHYKNIHSLIAMEMV